MCCLASCVVIAGVGLAVESGERDMLLYSRALRLGELREWFPTVVWPSRKAGGMARPYTT